MPFCSRDRVNAAIKSNANLAKAIWKVFNKRRTNYSKIVHVKINLYYACQIHA